MNERRIREIVHSIDDDMFVVKRRNVRNDFRRTGKS